jgi:glycosyltransferase involved in cell wall biosynthesis
MKTNFNPGLQRWDQTSVMGHKPSVSVVIPALNEAESLPQVLPHIPAWVDEIILVDGHSTDDTVAVAKAVRPEIRVVEQTGKGKGAAIRNGSRPPPATSWC